MSQPEIKTPLFCPMHDHPVECHSDACRADGCQEATPEQLRHFKVKAMIAELSDNNRRMTEATIAGIEMIIDQCDPRAAVIAVAYVSTRIAAGVEVAQKEQSRIVVPGRTH